MDGIDVSLPCPDHAMAGNPPVVGFSGGHVDQGNHPMCLKTYITIGCGLEVVQMSDSEGNLGCTDILMLAIAPMLWSH